MKIPGRKEDVTTEAARVSLENRSHAATIAKSRVEQDTTRAHTALSGSAARVDIGIARAINEELDPAKLIAERQARFEELKKLVQSGEYKASSPDVARALAEELTYEILGTPRDTAQE